MNGDYRELAITTFHLAKQEHDLLGQVLSLLGEIHGVYASGKPPTVDAALRWSKSVAQFRYDVDALTLTLDSVSQAIAPLMTRFDS